MALGTLAPFYSQLRRIFREALPAILGKSGQLPAWAKKAFNRRAEGLNSETMNPTAIFTSFTMLDLTQKSFGKRITWKSPVS